MKRRQFLRTIQTVGAASVAASVGMPNWVYALDADNVHRKEIGIQLYTLRKEIKKDARETIKALAEAGYHQVEPYGFPDCDGMLKAAKEFGLQTHSSHFNSGAVVRGKLHNGSYFDVILDKASQAGLTHLVIPFLGNDLRETLDDYKQICEYCNVAAEKAKGHGIQLAYHNHAFEFQPHDDQGRCGFDVMVDEFSEDMKFEVDVFWVAVANEDPVSVIKRLSGRVSQLHLKDLSGATKVPSYNGVSANAFEEIGDGVIDIDSIMTAALKSGVEHCHIEQDQSPDALASVQKSIKHLNTM